MNTYLIKNIIMGTFIIALSFMLPTLSHAQADTHGGLPRIDVDSKAYSATVKIMGLINKGDYDEAERLSRRLIKSEKRNNKKRNEDSDFYKGAYNSLCVSLTGLGRIDDAMQVCNQSIGFSPTNWESLKSRATLYYRTQSFQKSLDDFSLSLEHAPNNQEIIDVLNQNIGVVKSKIK